MASRRGNRGDGGGSPAAADDSARADDDVATVSGMAILDIGRTDRTALEGLEPRLVVRAAAEWGALMDGRLEVRDGAVVWVPGEYARRFGFIEFHVDADEVLDIRVASQPSRRGAVDIELTGDRTVAIRVPDPDRWRTELHRASGE